MIGIYKITSPSGRVYIGQAWDIKVRWRGYRKASILRQPLIAKSIIKYGFSAHTFEVIHELPADIDQEVLDRYEQLYMDLYKDAGFPLMNIRDAGSRGRVADETKEKLRISKTGTKHTEQTKLAMSLAGRGRLKSEEHKRKIGEKNKISQKGIISGYKNPKAKLTPEQVLEIRSRHIIQNKGGNIKLAKEFGVSVSTIERINNKAKSGSWLHL